MKLLFIRHGIAMTREEYHRIESDDRLRPLTTEGIKKLKIIASHLHKQHKRIDLLVSSPLTRAVQTAEIIAKAYRKKDFQQIEGLAPERHPHDILRWLKRLKVSTSERTSKFTVAIVGHEPHLSTTMSWMMSGDERPIVQIKKGGAALLEFRSGLTAGHAELVWLLKPSQLGVD
jgi:phosphohistidine phosphatase